MLNAFWNGFVIVGTVGTILACWWLLYWTKGISGRKGNEVGSTGHVWDEDLDEYNNPLPRWWIWLFWITIIFSVGYLWIYPGLVPLRRVPRPRRTQTFVGNYVSPSLGEGLEHGDVRPFVPGDRICHINWRASLRLDRLHVTRYHEERNADVVLMLDTLAQVGMPPATSLDFSLRAAASLAAAYLSRRDRVGLIEYGGVMRWVKPDTGRAQFERVLGTLLRAEAIFTYVSKDLDLIPPRVLPPRALVIALSPLLDARFIKAMSDVRARGFDLVVIAVSPIELTRASIAPSPVNDLACRLWALERRACLHRLRSQGLAVVEWDPAEPLELALASYRPEPRRGVVA